jgi:hypothetical protein
MSEGVLERFHRALIEEIRSQRPEYLQSPFTVAEIYQNLVPYGSHRDRIGVEMNGDYEDALVRLLAGEGEYLVLDSEPALRNLRAELKRPSPNTGVYREFAAVDVRLNRERINLTMVIGGDEVADEMEDQGEAAPHADAYTDEVPSLFGSAPDIGIVPPGVDIFAAAEQNEDRTGLDDESDEDHDPAVTRPPLEPEYVDPSRRAGATTGEDGVCLWCRAELPKRDKLNFCPFCGTDVNQLPCPGCGEAVEPGWRFCASCGTEAS